MLDLAITVKNVGDKPLILVADQVDVLAYALRDGDQSIDVPHIHDITRAVRPATDWPARPDRAFRALSRGKSLTVRRKIAISLAPYSVHGPVIGLKPRISAWRDGPEAMRRPRDPRDCWNPPSASSEMAASPAPTREEWDASARMAVGPAAATAARK